MNRQTHPLRISSFRSFCSQGFCWIKKLELINQKELRMPRSWLPTHPWMLTKSKYLLLQLLHGFIVSKISLACTHIYALSSFVFAIEIMIKSIELGFCQQFFVLLGYLLYCILIDALIAGIWITRTSGCCIEGCRTRAGWKRENEGQGREDPETWLQCFHQQVGEILLMALKESVSIKLL